MAEITVEEIAVEVKRHHPHLGYMASPNHRGYQTWGAYCRSHHDNPDTDCEFSEWGYATKAEAKEVWLTHVAEQIIQKIGG